jgi:Protein of unknown function (DUF1573)
MTFFSLPVKSRDLLLAVAAGCFVGSWFLIYAAWPTPEPDLWTKNTTIDLGDVYQRQEKTAAFEFVNHFPHDVEIVEMIKGCSCSEAAFSEKRIKPRQTAVLKVTWKTGQMRGRQGVSIDFVYKVENNETFHKIVRVEANVVPDINYEPKTIAFAGTIPETQRIRFSSGRMKRFLLANARANHPAFKAEVRDGNAVEVSFDGKTPVYANGLEPVLILETDSPNEPHIQIPLKIRGHRPTQ